MPVRSVHLVVLAASFSLLGCQPTVTISPPGAPVVIAQYDPTKAQLPLPNDLLLTQPPASLGLPPAETELITHFQARHGFPNDQEVPITLSFSNDPVSATAPVLDLATFTPLTFLVTVATGTQSAMAELEPFTASSYTVSGGVGTLTIHHKGRTPWPPGQYAVLVRGGPNGVKTTTGAEVSPSQVFYLVAQDKDLTLPENIGLLAAQAGSIAAARPLAAQLNGIRTLLRATGAFAAADAVFPHQELAVATTFAIAALHTQVQLDPGRGLVPLPIDLLRHPGPTGTLTALAACTFASGTLSAAGVCSSPAAAGFAALDGFSTTGPILAATSDLVRASTVNPATVQLYDLTDPAHPALVQPGTYIHEPCEFTSTCDGAQRGLALAPLVALQPAGATSGDETSVFRTRPLKDATDYAVVISDSVLDRSGNKLQAGTVAKILTFKNPLVTAQGTSQLTGVDDLTAGALEVMRTQLKPVLAAAAMAGIDADQGQVAMAYTFRTQTILSTAAKLAALPYQAAPTKFNAAPTVLTPAEAFAKHGVPPTLPSAAIDVVLEASLTTINLLDPLTGAFRSNPAAAQPETISALIAIPKVPLKRSGLTPLVIFRHGLGGGRVQMLPLANTFNAKGIIVVAIDAAKHGDRALCSKGSAVGCIDGVNFPCDSNLPAGAQGDAVPPGICPKGLLHNPVSAACAGSGCGTLYDPKLGGVSVLSSNYLISSNFFRSRDTFRQDIIDQSQLIHVLAPNPATAAGNPVFDYLAARGILIDPTGVGYIGQSLGSLQGVASVAANPRITSAVFNVGGGTVVDVFTNSPAFSSSVGALLASLGIVPGTAGYLQFLVVAKTMLDPADPLNFAGHLKGNTLPNLLGMPVVAQAPKKVLAQASYCDQVVPNPFNYLLAANLGTGPLPWSPSFGREAGDFQLFLTGTSAADAAAVAGSCASHRSNWVTHGTLIDFADPLMTSKVQDDAASFLLDGTQPSSLVILP